MIRKETQILRRLKKIFRTHMNLCDNESFLLNDKISDILYKYDVDSLDQVELLMYIEEEFEIEITDEESITIFKNYTVQGLLVLIGKKICKENE